MNKPLRIINIVSHYLFGIAALVFSFMPFISSPYFIGGIIIGAVIPLTISFFAHGYHHKFAKIPYVVIIIAGLVIGTVFILSKSLTLISILITWAIFDIVSASFKVFDSATEIKENKFEIIEILASLMEIVFGVILIIKLNHGIKGHVIALGIATLMTATKYLIDCVRECKLEAEEKGH